jgi:hypothetical protein
MKLVFMTGALGLVLSSMASHAADLPSKKNPPAPPVVQTSNSILAVNNEVALQFISIDYDYAEYGNGLFKSPTGLLDTEKGHVPGFSISAALMKN